MLDSPGSEDLPDLRGPNVFLGLHCVPVSWDNVVGISTDTQA
jgi:hypothetical protein